MKNFSKYIIVAALTCMAMGWSADAQTKEDWGDFKLFIDPGHSKKQNQGMYNYTEAEKVLRVALNTRAFLYEFTTATENTIHLSRDNDEVEVELAERSDMANAWGADFFYSIHSDAGESSTPNKTVFLFGGWYDNGTPVEKTPKGGKRFAEMLDVNLTGVMYKTGSRGPWYDRYFYDRVTNHTNKYPYLSVNRRSNMASMLSEGGYHTHPVQQALNINDSYKRLEAFGTFRSILEYRGINRPDKVMLAGVVTNSETGEAINNVTVKVDGQTVVTDSYESIFHNYTPNPDLIHNGFFLFEGLTPGQSYQITYSCPGYSDASKTVVMNTNPQGPAGENVTWGDVELVSSNPAKVASINVNNPNEVNPLNDILITFTRKMNQESVEQAFSIENVRVPSQATNYVLSWDNDYRLRVNINNLFEEVKYALKIDGSIAKNSQTDQFFDGDGDGEEGGNYVFEFTTIPADVEPPYVKSTTPAAESTMLYNLRPAIRIEFNEELAWNEDEANDAIVVTDKDGNRVEGTLTHTVINNASVLHLYPNDDLQLDACYLVKVKAGFKDLFGNIGTGTQFRFLTEYRQVLDQAVLDECVTGHWWEPEGSGSTAGTTDRTGVAVDHNTLSASSIHSRNDVTNTLCLTYEFDETNAGPWRIREYRSTQQNNYSFFTGKANYILQANVYGDGSNNLASHMVRIKSDNGLKYNDPKVIDFRGWDVLAWDLYNDDNIQLFTGSKTDIAATDQICYDSFFFRHTMSMDDYDMYIENDGLDDEGNPISVQDWAGQILFDNYILVKYDDTAEQTASLDDIPLEEEVSQVIVSMDEVILELGGDTYQLTATVVPETANQEVTWSSSDESVATVDETGLVTAIKSGVWSTQNRAPGMKEVQPVSCDIVATSVANPNVSGSCHVTVKNPTGIISISKPKVVKSVTYVNAAGMESTTPFDGMNIVVTTYKDGSRDIKKVVN